MELDEALLDAMAARGIAWTPTLAGFQATRRSAERRGQVELQRWLEASTLGGHVERRPARQEVVRAVHLSRIP